MSNFFFSSRRRHTRLQGDWSSDVCSSDLQKDREVGVEERPLTDEQKTSIAEVRRFYQAKVAEREILHRDALAKARSREEVEKLDGALRHDLERLTGDRDRKIDEIKKRPPTEH